MRVIDLTPDVKGGGKVPTAYIINQPLPNDGGTDPPLCLSTLYDCEGLAIFSKHSWMIGLGPSGNYETVKVVAYGLLSYLSDTPYHTIIDVRNLGMIAAGCCPPAILSEFLGAERIPD